MSELFEFLSEIWFAFSEKASTILFSFGFCLSIGN